jgi:hypothetical protein
MLNRFALVMHWTLFSIGAAIAIWGIAFLGLEINEARMSLSITPKSDTELINEFSPNQLERHTSGVLIDGLSLLDITRELDLLTRLQEVDRKDLRSWKVDWGRTIDGWIFLGLGVFIGVISALIGFAIRFVLAGENKFFPWKQKQ